MPSIGNITDAVKFAADRHSSHRRASCGVWGIERQSFSLASDRQCANYLDLDFDTSFYCKIHERPQTKMRKEDCICLAFQFVWYL
jgi:hypothetical protein